VLVVMMLVAINRTVDQIDFSGILRTFALAGLCVVPSGGLWWALDRFVVQPNPGKAPAALALIVGGLAGVWLYYWLAKRAGMREASYLERATARLQRQDQP
jgi:membrane protein DedA with SNARE-associated domain